MTQQQPQKKYLVTRPEGAPPLKECLVSACEGNRKIGDLLYFFLDHGAFVAEHTGQNPDELDFIRLTSLPLDKIAKSVGTSKMSLSKWIPKLKELGYIIPDGYHQQYDIYFRNVQKALSNPPAKVSRPARGVHAKNKESEESTLGYKNKASEIKNKASEIEESTLEMLKVESLILNLNSKILYLESLLSRERACREALEAKVEALYTIIDTFTDTDKESMHTDESSAPQDDSANASSLTHTSSQEIIAEKGEPPPSVKGEPPLQSGEQGSATVPKVTTAEPTQLSLDVAPQDATDCPIATVSKTIEQTVTPNETASTAQVRRDINKGEKQAKRKRTPIAIVALTAEEQRIYDFYSKLWFIAVPPALNENTKAHCAKLAPFIKTQEDMEALEKFTRKNNTFKSKVIYLGNLVNCVNAWLQTRPRQVVQKPLLSQKSTENDMGALALKALEMAKQKGRDIQVQTQVQQGGAVLIVQWNTPHFEEPVVYKKPEWFYRAFNDMCAIWNDSAKAQEVVHG